MDIDIDNFMGFILKESTSEQIKNTLSANGISFKEYPDFFDKEGKTIRFSYESGNMVWSCSLDIKDDMLRFISIHRYSPDSPIIFKLLCKELSERYGSTHRVSISQDKYEGTETMSFSKNDNDFHFTEIVYDSSPILGQKNIRINYF